MKRYNPTHGKRNCSAGRRKAEKNPPTWNIAFAADWRGSDADQFCFVFHGAFREMLTTVFDILKGNLFDAYDLEDEHQFGILNGRCYRAWVVHITNPDLQNMSLREWTSLITLLLQKHFRCKVTFFKDYEKFLNA